MPKRKNEDQLIQLYQAKIKMLEKQHAVRRRRIIVSSDSESDSQNEGKHLHIVINKYSLSYI